MKLEEESVMVLVGNRGGVSGMELVGKREEVVLVGKREGGPL